MSCDACSDFMAVIPIKAPESLKATASLIKERGLRHVGPSSGDNPSDWWGDWIEEYFSCRHCGQVFHLEVEAYHGSGGALEPSSETVQDLSERFAASKAAVQLSAQNNHESRQTKSRQNKTRQFWKKFDRSLMRGLVNIGLIFLGVLIANLLFQLFSR